MFCFLRQIRRSTTNFKVSNRRGCDVLACGGGVKEADFASHLTILPSVLLHRRACTKVSREGTE